MNDFDIEAHRAKELQNWIAEGADEIAKALRRRRCGNCEFHMKSRMCPREHNVRGYSRGPSFDAFPCSEFKSDWNRRILEEAQVIAKLLEM